MALWEEDPEEGSCGEDATSMGSVSAAVVMRPVPAPRGSLVSPDKSQAHLPVPHWSRRDTTGKHSNLHNLPKSACNVVSNTVLCCVWA